MWKGQPGSPGLKHVFLFGVIHPLEDTAVFLCNITVNARACSCSDVLSDCSALAAAVHRRAWNKVLWLCRPLLSHAGVFYRTAVGLRVKLERFAVLGVACGLDLLLLVSPLFVMPESEVC